MSEVRRFEQVSRDSGVPIAQLRPAHYALCASLDDVVQATPWGSEGAWASRSLVSTFHQEVRSGDRFFDVLNQVKQNPGLFLPVLELMYLCLSLGFQGRYRLSPRGPAELDRMREDVYGIIARQRPKPDPELSPRWRGVTAPYRAARAELPVWVAGAAGLVVICGMYAWTLFGLNDGSDALFARTMAAPPAQMPVIVRAAPVQPPAPAPAPAQPGALDKLRGFLRPEIEQGLVAVLGTDAAPVVRVRNRGMFAAGSAAVASKFNPLLERIGQALGGGARLRAGDRVYRQPADPLVAISVQLPIVRGAGEGGGGDHREDASATCPGSRPRGARMPIRSGTTRRRRDARRTGGSRWCCDVRGKLDAGRGLPRHPRQSAMTGALIGSYTPNRGSKCRSKPNAVT